MSAPKVIVQVAFGSSEYPIRREVEFLGCSSEARFYWVKDQGVPCRVHDSQFPKGFNFLAVPAGHHGDGAAASDIEAALPDPAKPSSPAFPRGRWTPAAASVSSSVKPSTPGAV